MDSRRNDLEPAVAAVTVHREGPAEWSVAVMRMDRTTKWRRDQRRAGNAEGFGNRRAVVTVEDVAVAVNLDGQEHPAFTNVGFQGSLFFDANRRKQLIFAGIQDHKKKA